MNRRGLSSVFDTFAQVDGFYRFVFQEFFAFSLENYSAQLQDVPSR
jgi:hypothetical protein